jgi:hypothetical protein
MDRLEANQLSHWRAGFLTALAASGRSTQRTAAPLAPAAAATARRVERAPRCWQSAAAVARPGVSA